MWYDHRTSIFFRSRFFPDFDQKGQQLRDSLVVSPCFVGGTRASNANILLVYVMVKVILKTNRVR